MTRREPVSPETCTVLGYRIGKRNMGMWTGLDFSRAIYPPGNPSMSVPFTRPDNDPEDDIRYRVRPRRKRGFLRFEQEPDGSWVIVRKPAPPSTEGQSP
jgi:hypothetical protein